MKRPAFLTRQFWSFLFRRVRRAFSSGDSQPAPMVSALDAHKMDPDAEEQLSWVSASVPIKPADGVQIIEINVWTEGVRKCAEHCWHRVATKQSHQAALKLSHGSEHSDYACCRCTNGLCHTGTRSAWLDNHPLTRYHKREPIVRRAGK
jgi:hypothetical protein